MSKKTRLEDIDPEAGPFRVPESQFPDGAFTDEDVERAMNEAVSQADPVHSPPSPEPSYVSEGPPEWEPEPPPPPRAPTPSPAAHAETPSGPSRAPSLPPPPAGQSWATEAKPSLYVEDEPNIPPIVTDRPRAARAEPAESSGLVMEVGNEAPAAPAAPEPESDAAYSAMNYLALGILAMVIGMAGAGCLLFVFTQATGGDEVVEVAAPEPDVGIPVRRTMNAPRPTPMEENIREFEEREAAGQDGAAPPEVEAPPVDPRTTPPAGTPDEETKPIGSQLP